MGGSLISSRSRALIAAAAAAASLAGAAPALGAPPVGALTQLAGAAGCLSISGSSEDGPGTCGTGAAIDGAESVVVSPDGRNVYVDSYQKSTEAGISVFARNSATGALTQLAGTSGCLTVDGASQAGPGTCTRVRGLTTTGDGRDLAFTSDGRWAYMAVQAATHTKPGILIFQRDPATGALTPLPGSGGCITSDGSSQDGPGTCQVDNSLVEPNGLTVSSDDRFVYVTDYNSPNSRVHVFSRNTATGALAEIECLRIAPATPDCTGVARVVGDDEAFVISPDGRHAYSGAYPSNGISIFDRDPTTGLLTQKSGTAGCITEDGKDNTGTSTCAVGKGLQGAWVVTLSPDGNTLYVTSYSDNGIAVFHVNGDGSLTQLAGTTGCITLDGTSDHVAGVCGVGRALLNPYLTTVSPDGRTLYVAQWATGTIGSGGMAIFSLDPNTGAATQLPGLEGCVTSDGSSNGTPGQCADGTALSGGYSVAVSPDGASVYEAAYEAQAVSVFARQTAPTCSGAGVSTAYGTAISIPLSCADADGDAITRSIVTGPAHGTLGAVNQGIGTVTYTPAHGFIGTDQFTFMASDGTNASTPVTETVTVQPPPRPTISRLRQSARKWRRGHKPAKISRKRTPPIGTTFSFVLNETATVKFTFLVPEPGRKVGRKCVARNAHNVQRRACTRLVVTGSLRFTGHAGTDRVYFDGLLPHHKRLALGSYVLEIVATNAIGQKSATKTVKFTIVA